MRNIRDLAHSELVQVVQAIHGRVYVDLTAADHEVFNPDKSVDGEHLRREVTRIFAEHDLIPDEQQPFIAANDSLSHVRFVVYDPATRDLVSRAVCGSEAEAADACGYRDGVLILSLVVPDSVLTADSSSAEDEREPCECELAGYFYCGVPGIIAHFENGRLAADGRVERCDLCQRYPSDDAALTELRRRGLA